MKWGAIGIAAFLIVAALMQVGNTIRLAAFARRREIGIMRLVGASSLYIQLPFLLEALVAALIGVVLAGAALGCSCGSSSTRAFATRSTSCRGSTAEYLTVVAVIAVIGLLLTLVPTLVMTRKYLKV